MTHASLQKGPLIRPLLLLVHTHGQPRMRPPQALATYVYSVVCDVWASGSALHTARPLRACACFSCHTDHSQLHTCIPAEACTLWCPFRFVLGVRPIRWSPHLSRHRRHARLSERHGTMRESQHAGRHGGVMEHRTTRPSTRVAPPSRHVTFRPAALAAARIHGASAHP